MPDLVTIGVYGFALDAFVDRLHAADVRLLVDVRQRRGVRGPEYAWANSLRLQAALAQARIGYQHHRELAPTTDLRQLQYAEDHRQGVGKRNRRELAAEYTRRYTAEILNPVDLAPLVAALPTAGTAALFCVERDHHACHRSLIAQRLATEYGLTIEHLSPATDHLPAPGGRPSRIGDQPAGGRSAGSVGGTGPRSRSTSMQVLRS